MLTKQVLDQNNKYQKCYKLFDNKDIVSATATQERNSTYHWDNANCSHVLSVMSLPSPNGSTSSIFSSEDSSSTISNFSTRQSSQAVLHQSPIISKPSSSSIQSGPISKQLKFCRVCGDRAKSYHFGGISCDSCKAFFRRSVQNDAFRNFHCPYERHCDITINSRKSCQYCRFNKCISIGMEKSWVMTEEERMQMLRNRMEKRKQEEESVVKSQVKVNQIYDSSPARYEPDLTQINSHLTEEEVKLIEKLVNLYLKCSKEISFKIKIDASKPSRTNLFDLFFTAIQQFALFAQQFESFTCISNYDKQILLKNGVLEMCFLRGAFIYDMKGKFWQYDPLSPSSIIYSDHLEILVTKCLLEKHTYFIKTLKRLNLDEVTNILLTIIVLLSSDREGLVDSQLVQKEQEKYLLLLKSYMNWSYGTVMSSILYPKLLLKLTDLRELAEAHTDYQLLLGREELEEIQQRLSALHIGISSGVDKDRTVSLCHLKQASSSTISDWDISKCLVRKCSFTRSLYADEELSTSSEGSDKLSSD